MNYPKYFDDVKPIIQYDPLSELLGTTTDGITQFNFIDLAKIAGHTCPTVAGAYLMTYKALEALFPEQTPIRGGVKVEFKEAEDDGTAGVTGNIVSCITGATSNFGFHGLYGKFKRQGLMFFNAPITSHGRFTRVDNNKSVDVFYTPGIIPSNPKMPELLRKVKDDLATPEEAKEFAELWQERVKAILIDHFDDEGLIRVVAS